MEWFAFQAKDEVLGMDAQYIYRLVDDAKVTPVPLTPECHLGLTYYRGELFNVVDIANLLGHGKTDLERTPLIILVKWLDKKLGIVPNRVVGLLWVEDDSADLSTYTTEENYTVRHITPEFIWDTLTRLPYGPYQI